MTVWGGWKRATTTEEATTATEEADSLREWKIRRATATATATAAATANTVVHSLRSG